MKKNKKQVQKTVEQVSETEIVAEKSVEIAPDVAPIETKSDTPDYLWLVSCVLITGIASFLRFFQLELKPFHHDEGVNGYFLTTLFRDGKYTYDPANYHGPDLYYLSLAFSKVFGLNTLSVRSSVAIFGVLTVVLAFCLKKYIGKTGSLFAALFLALSPGMAFISRYFIHEILFVFFSFAIVVAIVFFIEKRKAGIFAIGWTALLLIVCFLPSTLNLASALAGDDGSGTLWPLRGFASVIELMFGVSLLWPLRILFFLIEAALVGLVINMLLTWQNGRPIYLILASASVSLLFATKETGFITVGTMLIACFFVWLWRKIAATENFANAKLWIFAVPTGLFLFGTIVDHQRYIDFYKWFSGEFLKIEDGIQPFVFYSILALPLVALAVWILILSLIRRKDSDESNLTEPIALTWENFREKLMFSDNWEFLLVKSGLGALTIFLTWLLVRVGVDLAVAWKANKGLGEAWSKIEFTKVDYSILAIGFVLSAVALSIWKLRRPAKISSDFVLMAVVVVVTFLYVGAVFFSSFFSYPEGLQGAFKAYAIWTKTGNTDHTQNGFWAYLKWGMKIESPLLILSALGFLIAFVKTRHRFAMFAGLWSLGLFLAYTIIPYKTPWLALSFLLPMCLTAGYAINELLASRHKSANILGAAAAGLASLILVLQTYDINFKRYDDDSMPYIYAHTKRGFLDIVKQIEYYADKSGRKLETQIEIVSPDYWPMPWYLNDYKSANFHGRIVDANAAEIIVAKKEEQETDIVEKYASRYKYAGEFSLRPGVELVLLVRKDLADSDAQDIYAVFGEPVTIFPETTEDNQTSGQSVQK